MSSIDKTARAAGLPYLRRLPLAFSGMRATSNKGDSR